MKYTTAIIIVLFFSSCQKNSVSIIETPINQEFQLTVGQEATVKNEHLTIKFTELEEDSRCPKGAVCIWQGNGRIALELRRTGDTNITTSLNTTVDPTTIVHGSYEIRLKELTPYPELNTPGPLEKYVATLVVVKK